MPTDQDRWELLIQGLRAGDRHATQAFWDQYGGLLQAVAEKHLTGGLRRRVGPEDVVQSACRTFLRRAKGGEFRLDDSEGLWRLLCAITLTKIREQARFHLRKKRGLNQEAPLDVGPGQSGSAFPLEAPGPTPAEAAEFSDQFQQLLAEMDEEERAIVDLKLQEFTHEEVAEQLGCSERTVRRVLKRVQARLAKVFGTEGE
jgi:RNA polymerase sigma factor (sigma-70 family)